MAGTFSVGGLFSGLDTNTIISQLMALERRPLQLLQQKADTEQSKLKAVQSLKTQFTALQSIVNRLADRSAINTKTAVTDTPTTSPTIVSASAGPDAVNGSFKVTVSQLATATNVLSSSAIGAVVDKNVALGSAGLRITPITDAGSGSATFQINGRTITVDNATTLDNGPNSVVALINGAGAGVTASLVADPDGRPGNRIKLEAAPGQSIQLGSLADTSNVLKALNLMDATIQSATAANVRGGTVAAGALNTTVTINGVATAITQSDGSFTAQQNAAFIAAAINGNSANTVEATASDDGTITLRQKTVGSAASIVIQPGDEGTGTGFSAGTTANGTNETVTSSANLGVVDTGKALASSRLATPISGLDASGNGKFTINGVDVSYSSADTLATVVNRINASKAGVTAFYDPIQDRLRLTANQTGARTMTLSDVTGNFLAATGVLGASQSLGQNAQFSIDGVNGGQTLTSSSNTVSGYIPGVTLNLKSTSASPVTVTVSQNTSATADLLRQFVNQYNAIADAITDATKYNADTKEAGLLSGDSGVLALQSALRSFIGSSALGASGSYQTFSSIGVSTGVIGSKAGTTSHLTLDEAKLTAALQDNPQAVESLLSGFQVAFGAPTGVGNVTAVSGSPVAQHQSGTYHITVTDTTTNSVDVTFVTSDGRQLLKTSGTLSPGVDNTALIPGVTLRANGALTLGEDQLGMTVTSRGLGVSFKDYLSNLLGPDGFFATREDASEAVSKSLSDQMASMQDRLSQKEDALNRQFASLETMMAQFQSQSSQLSAALAKLNSQ